MNRMFGAMFLWAATSFVAAQQTTLRFPVGVDDIDVVTFDESRVSAKDVKHWMKFAETGYYGSVGVSLSGCDESAVPRTTKDLIQSRRVRDELESETDYPGQLSPAVIYLKRILALKIWLGEQYLAFAKSRTTPDPVYQELDVKACRVVAERIQHERDAEKACQLLGSEWTNCILDSNLRQLGDYPRAEWKAFLAENGMQERVASTTSEWS
jgi:hypothetical protein